LTLKDSKVFERLVFHMGFPCNGFFNYPGLVCDAYLRPCPHRAKTGENDPVLFYAVQEYLLKNGFIAKPHRAVETLW
jgi:hypothetical protein